MAATTPLTVVAAPDKFRGTATASAAALAIASAAEAMGCRCVQRPMADGGEGTLLALGGPTHTSLVTGPLGSPVRADWRLDGGEAVIEMASASGLELAGGADGNDPIHATSRGTGELVREAVEAGANRIIVAIGGSACTDGGQGAVDVLADLRPFDGSKGVELIVAVDVATPFPEAAHVFGPQKGATPRQVIELSERLDRIALDYRTRLGVDVRHLSGSGAGGGLAGGLAALGARLRSGFDLVAEETGLREELTAADLVITGEGKMDDSSYRGKVLGGVAHLARQVSTPWAAIVGQVEEGVDAGLQVVDLVETYGRRAALHDTAKSIGQATAALLQRHRASR